MNKNRLDERLLGLFGIFFLDAKPILAYYIKALLVRSCVGG